MTELSFYAVFWLVIAAAAGVVGIVALWAAVGRAHWFWRAAGIGTVLSLTVVMSAYDLLLLYGIQSLVVIAPLTVRRIGQLAVAVRSVPLEEQRHWAQYTLLDLLLLMPVVAAVSAVAVRFSVEGWELWGWYQPYRLFFPDAVSRKTVGIVLGRIGGIFGLLTLAAVWIAFGRGHVPQRLLVLVLCFPATWLCLPAAKPSAAQSDTWFPIAAAIYSPTVLMAGWLGLLRAWRCLGHVGVEWPRVRKCARITLALSTLVVLLPLGLIYAVIAPAPRVPEVVLPEPNGYDDLMEASRMLHGIWIRDRSFISEWNIEACEGYDIPSYASVSRSVGRCSEVYAKVEEALQRKCRIPPRYDLPHSDPNRAWLIRGVAMTVVAKGSLAEVELRRDEAIEAYLNVSRIGRALESGGLPNDLRVGWGIEKTGLSWFAGVVETLTPEQCRHLIAAIQSIDAGREPIEDTMKRGRLWEMSGGGWMGRLMFVLSWMTQDDERARMNEQADHVEALYQLLTAELAVRCYEAEHGCPPQTLAELVPGYLPEAPLDPRSGRSLVYRREGHWHLLRCVANDDVITLPGPGLP
jgi:hypothetical protein